MNFLSVLSAVGYLEPLAVHTLKVSLFLVLVLAILYIVRGLPASIRSFVLGLALAGIAVLPLSSLLLPSWEAIAIPAVDLFQSPAPTSTAEMRSTVTPLEQVSETSSPPSFSNPTSRPFPWRPVAAVVYFVGALFCLLRLVIAWRIASRLRQSAKPAGDADERIASLGAAAACRVGLRRPAMVRFSDRITVPITCGWVRPVILLPLDAVLWSHRKLESVLAHETAHIIRKDNLVSCLMHLAILWQWFNPLPRLVLRQYYREREKACDDLVLSGGVRDVDYAGHLMEIGRSAAAVAWPAPAALAGQRPSDFERRLMDILNINKRRGPVTAGIRILVVLLAVSLMAPLAVLAGKPSTVLAGGVSPEQQEALVTVISDLYHALSAGDDFQSIRDRFLSKDYFDRPELTMENLDRRQWDTVIKRMTAIAVKEKLNIYPRVSVLITAIRPENDRYLLTERLNLTAPGVNGGEVRVVDNYEHQIEMVKEDGQWKVSRYDDGVSLMRMDIDNPYGPIFLFWVHEQNKTTTPLGPWIAKVLPASIREANTPFLKFVVEE